MGKAIIKHTFIYLIIYTIYYIITIYIFRKIFDWIMKRTSVCTLLSLILDAKSARYHRSRIGRSIVLNRQLIGTSREIDVRQTFCRVNVIQAESLTVDTKVAVQSRWPQLIIRAFFRVDLENKFKKCKKN